MIPRADITAWRNVAPWQANEQVEQDLVISRSLVEIFSDDFLRENLAFRGGTALHKLYINPSARYSEDIDLVQIKAGPIGPIADRLRDRLGFLGKPKADSHQMMFILRFRFQTEIEPVINSRLKVEINGREHYSVYGFNSVNYRVENSWFKGDCEINTFELNDLLGTKTRALYQRSKGRDLFDLYHAITKAGADPQKIVKAFKLYIENQGLAVSKKVFIANMEEKMQDENFRLDTPALLIPGLVYNIDDAWKFIKYELIELL